MVDDENVLALLSLVKEKGYKKDAAESG